MDVRLNFSHTIDDYITDGYDGIVTGDVVSEVETLLNDEKRARRVGCEARITAKGRHPLDRFLRRWEILLQKTVELKGEGVL